MYNKGLKIIIIIIIIIDSPSRTAKLGKECIADGELLSKMFFM